MLFGLLGAFSIISLSISTLSVLLFAITKESYAVAVVFLLLVMKGILLLNPDTDKKIYRVQVGAYAPLFLLFQ